MSEEHKQRLHDYLTKIRKAVIWKAEGLSEYDVRRPLTRTGTNLLGLIKNLSVGEPGTSGRSSTDRSSRTRRGGTTTPQKAPTCG
jgi:hypothetical protein